MHTSLIAKLTIASLLVVVVMMTAAWLLLGFGPGLEARYMPPVTSGYAKILKTEENKTTVLVGGNKVRNCDLVGMSATVLKNGEWQSAEMFTDKKFIRTVPEGLQVFGIYFLYDTEFKGLRLQARYQCHRMWSTVANLVDVSKEQMQSR